MNFSSDRDLLALEPGVFSDVPFLAQQRCAGNDGVVVGVTLHSTACDFEAAQVETGMVVLVAGVAHEVMSRTDAHTLSISQLRPNLSGPAIAGTVGSGLAVTVRTFAPQAALVHDVLLRLVGIEPDDPMCKPNEDSLVSMSVMARLEALGTLERVFSAAAAIEGDQQALWRKARQYQQEFQRALQRATILMDVNGDGLVDVRRQPGVVHLLRR